MRPDILYVIDESKEIRNGPTTVLGNPNNIQISDINLVIVDDNIVNDLHRDDNILHGTSNPPETTPTNIGNIFIRDDKVYIATGTSSPSDWTILN